MTTPNMRSWAKKECDQCGCEAQFSRSEPKDFNQPFLCSDCKMAKSIYDAGYTAGYADGLAAAKTVKL